MSDKINYIKVGLADDHVLLRTALATLIDGFGDCKVVLEADNGKQFLNELKDDQFLDVAILDLNMPVMDGFDLAKFLQESFPRIHVLMLTMYDAELSLIRLLQSGVKGFLKKDVTPTELKF